MPRVKLAQEAVEETASPDVRGIPTDADLDRITDATALELATQPKVKIRLRKDPSDKQTHHPFCINGWPIWVPKGVWVDVPKTVAELADEAGLT